MKNRIKTNKPNNKTIPGQGKGEGSFTKEYMEIWQMPVRTKLTASFQNTWEVYKENLKTEMDLAEISSIGDMLRWFGW